MHDTQNGTVFSFDCIFWYSKHVAHCMAVFLMSEFKFKLDTDFLTKSLIFQTAPVSTSTIEKILLLFPALHSNAINPCQHTSIWPVVFHAVFHFSLCVASLVLYMILAFAGWFLLGLLPVCLLWMCTMAYLLMC